MPEICSVGIDTVNLSEECKTSGVQITLPEWHIIPVEGGKVLWCSG